MKNDERDDVLQILLDEMKAVRKDVQAATERVAGLEVSMKRLTEMTARLDAAVYGNGKPGLRAQTDMLLHRVDQLESRGVDDLKAKIDLITQRHEEEDRKRELEAESAQKEKEREQNYKWQIRTMIVLVGADLVARVLGVDFNVLEALGRAIH